MRSAAIFAFAALPAFAQGQVYGTVSPANVYSWGGASPIRMQAPDDPSAFAMVTFQNASIHGTMIEMFSLTFDGLTVHFEATVGNGMEPDELCAYPPAGMVAMPECISVPEDDVGVIRIYWLVG
jgi:hypothetical protein